MSENKEEYCNVCNKIYIKEKMDCGHEFCEECLTIRKLNRDWSCHICKKTSILDEKRKESQILCDELMNNGTSYEDIKKVLEKHLK